jgi:hypothetical protein
MSNKNDETILFLLVNNFTSGGSSGGGTPRSGLLNSASMTAAQITQYLHYKTVVEIVANVEAIGPMIEQYSPKLVILEAVWVTPAQLSGLLASYPNVVFITRVHSEVPFLAHENNIISNIKQLAALPNSYVAFNSYETEREFFALGYTPVYLPNIYCDVYTAPVPTTPFTGKTLAVGCFGSVRPMKNQLIQAMMAMIYCDIHKLTLTFHMNGTRVEQQGGCALGNIQALFAGTIHTLVLHPWLDKADFLALVAQMDLGMQLSFNESFNIVSANFVEVGVPVIVSDTINWMPKESRASVDSMDDILSKIGRVLKRRPKAVRDNIAALDKHNTQSIKEWGNFLKSI